MGSKACVSRLQKEYKAILKASRATAGAVIQRRLSASGACAAELRGNSFTDQWLLLLSTPVVQEPVPQITAHPAPNNLLEWH